VLQTARFAEQYLNEQDPVLDLGVYASEILCILRRMGYSQLSGVDLNPRLKSMPQADVVRYEVCDFMATPFPDASFKLITAISVIEHGFDGRRLLAEVSRLLLPGGFFVASFDYWPDKISTDGIRMFDMDWTIFSEPEIRSFLREAAVYGLAPQGNTDLTARERPIHCAERDYTFAWLVLRKD
jgi:SAM-dependent methyltransferase